MTFPLNYYGWGLRQACWCFFAIFTGELVPEAPGVPPPDELFTPAGEVLTANTS